MALKTSEKIKLERASSPEEVGVSGKAVAEFLDDIEKTGIKIHSFMVLRHGKVAAECYRAPFTAERPHAMYSVSKTFTATAIGLAVHEGLLSVDDKVRDFFPDYTEGINDSRLDKLTVKHLLTMTSGKNPSVFADKSTGDWIKFYFDSPWVDEPGEKFRYINENIYMLCAILFRVTGGSVRDFLMPRLFEPLGIDYPFWETDNYGIEAGGWGLYIKTEDLAKLMLCYNDGGKFNGKQVLPAEWVAQATQALVPNRTENTDIDSSEGYGYCIWRCGGAKGYRADGMFSQFGIVFEELDAVLVVTAGEAIEQRTRDFIWKHFPAAFIDENAPAEDTACPELYTLLQNAVFEDPQKLDSKNIAEKINGQPIHFKKKIFLNLIGFPVSMLPLAITYMTTDKAGNIDNVTFDFGDTKCFMSWTEGDETNTVPVGTDGRFCYGTMRLGQIDYKVCCNAKWLSSTRLYVQVRPVETIGKRMLDFRFFNNGRVTMNPTSEPSIESIGEFLEAGLEDSFKFKPVVLALKFAIHHLLPIIEPQHKGRIKYN